MSEMDVVSQVANKTDNDVILFTIIILIALVVVMLPLYRIILSGRKFEKESENSRRENELDEKKLIISVVTSNTDVMSQLKATLETIGINTNSALARIHDRIDACAATTAELKGQLSSLDALLIEHHNITKGGGST